MAPRKRRRSGRICALCGAAIGTGDGLRRVALPHSTTMLSVHERCYAKDWEFVESGLEPMPVRQVERGR